ncbi:hypothetical protein VTN49DRAFT_2256 [Thermomyces lanuginosus]|uniref:uncharacterized protein n=1 Tax=Thermomyces lanuginosus TaxID=5541 RepID=UPI0037422F7D
MANSTMQLTSSSKDRRQPWNETPLIESAELSKRAQCRIFLKLELLQPGGSFKSRGIGNLILSYLSDPANHDKKLHFYSSSGGNAGFAAVVAARDLGCPCTVVLPTSTKPIMVEKLRSAGATEVIQHGASWYEADTFLRARFIDAPPNDPAVKNVYVPPFDHPLIWEGNSTMVEEIAAQLPPRINEKGEKIFPADVIICSVGGGGLLNGVIQGLEKYLRRHPQPEGARDIQVVAVETKGADSLAYSLQKGSHDSLQAITSQATTLGALRVSERTYSYARSPPTGITVTSVVLSDAEAARGVVTLADECRLLVELACGVNVDVAVGPRLKEAVKDLNPDSRVVVITCGGNGISPEIVAEYRHRLRFGWDEPVMGDQKED